MARPAATAASSKGSAGAVLGVPAPREGRVTTARRRAITRYLATGQVDTLYPAWPGGPFIGGQRARKELAEALIDEVNRRARGRRGRRLARGLDLTAFTRAKVEPMVRGLFPAQERKVVLGLVEHSVVFFTRSTIERILREERCPSTAWALANLYLRSLGAEPLGDEEMSIVGFSQETTCYVSMNYFAQGERFADFVVHEAAHVFHNCKREAVGLPATRRREWLLEIDFRMRETFAYGCEAFSRLCELGKTPRERRRLLGELLEGPMPPDERVDPEVYREMLEEAVAARHGWQRILARCEPG